MKKNIVLIGFMGTGKTSVGKILARRLKKTVRDVDEFIEAKEKRSIRDIFEKDGEVYFRRAEKEAVQALAREENVVITTGGGVVLDPENTKVLSENGWIVALHASPETIFRRVKHSRKRPLLQDGDMLSEIKKLLEARRPFYRRADFSLDTDGKNAAQVTDRILSALREKV